MWYFNSEILIIVSCYYNLSANRKQKTFKIVIHLLVVLASDGRREQGGICRGEPGN